MAIIGTAALANSAATYNPTPIFTANQATQISGFIITNSWVPSCLVTIYRNATTAAGIIYGPTALAINTTVTYLWAQGLGVGEVLYATGLPGGFVSIEVDGILSGVTSALTTNQMLLGMMLQYHQAWVVDMPSQNELAALGYNM
jgi:hypothetical protein